MNTTFPTPARLEGVHYDEVEVSISTSDWSNSAPYTYTWESALITNSCMINILFKTDIRTVLQGDINYQKSSGGIQFTATSLPTGTITLAVQIIDGGTVHQAPQNALPNTIKQALLDCFSHVAWTNDQGQSYYETLSEAFFGIASINATLMLSNNIIRESNNLNDLRQYLTVTAITNDNVSTTLGANEYELSGTIALNNNEYDKSTQTITLTYGGKSTTIQVPVYNAMTLDKVTLPSGYTQLSTILSTRSSGTIGSYIDTGINGIDIDHVEYGVQAAIDFANGENGHILASSQTWYPYFRRGSSGTQTFQRKYKTHGTTAIEINYAWESNTNYVIKAYPTIEINGTVVEICTSGGTTTDSNTFIFARSTSSGEPHDICQLRLFYLKMYDSQNQLTHNYVPCKNDSNIVGLYDTVSELFLTSANENYSFVAGEAV